MSQEQSVLPGEWVWTGIGRGSEQSATKLPGNLRISESLQNINLEPKETGHV